MTSSPMGATTMTDSIQQRVAKGAAWLDTVRPGWRDSISLDKLDIASGCECVCGQTFGGYSIGTELLRGSVPYDTEGYYGIVVGHAFLHQFTDLAELNAEWRRVIHQGRELPTHPAAQREAVQA